MDTCHICLEDIENIPQEIIKKCCDAFICNDCWIRLKDNPETFQCPICKYPISNRVTINVETERSFYDRYEKCIQRICQVLFYPLVGYLIITIILLIAYYDNMDLFWKDIGYISTKLHFWLAIYCFGYIVIHLIKACLRCICQN